MAKGSKRQRRVVAKTRARHTATPNAASYSALDNIDDEIDAFHKQRDVIPLDVNAGEDDSDEDMEQPVFNFEDDMDSDQESSDEDDHDDANYNTHDKGLAAKIVRQAKYLREKFGGGEDEMDDEDDDKEEEGRRGVWGRRKSDYYGADNFDYELQSSDEDQAREEEAEVMKIQAEKAKCLSALDMGFPDTEIDVSDNDGGVKARQDILVEGNVVARRDYHVKFEDGTVESYVEAKDFDSLSKEEKMDIAYSTVPEVVGLLSELNDSLDELHKLKTLLSEGQEGDGSSRMKFLKVKHIQLLTYCQAISFYLILKAEGHEVRDHPVIPHLIEIKTLLEKMKQIEPKFSAQAVNKVHCKLADAANKLCGASTQPENEAIIKNVKINPHDIVSKAATMQKDALSVDLQDHKIEEIQMGSLSKEMMKVRADLEAKWKKVLSDASRKPEKGESHAKKPMNGYKVMQHDFDDEMGKATLQQGSGARLSKLSQPANKVNHHKLASGDDDLPARDEIGERRRKHELRVLARAGASFTGEVEDDEDEESAPRDMDDSENSNDALESEDEFYRQVKKQRAEKLRAKAELYSRTPVLPSALQEEVDGKRQITYQMEKNKGLTRSRKKLLKNPRKKYRHKHDKAVIRRKGQVRDIRKSSGPYGGETTGINTSVSHSVRFKS